MSSASEINRETYDRLWASLGDFIRHNPGARHRRRWVLDLLGHRPFESLLDVGCGNGLLLSLIDARYPGKRLAGADLSQVVVEQNRRELPHIRFEHVDLAVQELPTGYDVVTCCEVVEHVDDAPGAIRKLAAACVPGGRVVITCPTGTMYATEKHFGHVYHPKRDELVAWAAAAGLELEEIVCWGFPLYALTKWATNLNPQMALEQFGTGKKYGPAQKLISSALYWANFINVPTSERGVQLFTVFKKTRDPA